MTLRLFKFPVSAERWRDSIPAGYSCGLRGGRNIITVETGAGEPEGDLAAAVKSGKGVGVRLVF